MEKKFIIIVLIFAVMFFTGGVLTGFAWQSVVNAGAKLPQKAAAVQTLSSKIIPSITAFGNVSKIDGRKITLSYQGDSLAINIKEGAEVYLPSKTVNDANGKAQTIPQKQVSFEDIKVGQNVSVNIKLLADGQMEGQMVIIISEN